MEVPRAIKALWSKSTIPGWVFVVASFVPWGKVWKLVQLGGDIDFLLSFATTLWGWISGTPRITLMAFGIAWIGYVSWRESKGQRSSLPEASSTTKPAQVEEASTETIGLVEEVLAWQVAVPSKLLSDGRWVRSGVTPPCSVAWTRHKAGTDLWIRLINSTDKPIVGVSTEVVALRFWNEFSWQEDNKHQNVYITGAATTNPFLLTDSEDDIHLVVAKAKEFELKSNRDPSEKVARNIPGTWGLQIRVSVGEASGDLLLMFSWFPEKKPPLTAKKVTGLR